MRRGLRRLVLAAVAAAIGACGSEDPGGSAADPPASTETAAGPAVDERYRRYVAPQSYPLAFSTSLPADLSPEVDLSDDGAALTFARAGDTADSTFLHLFVFPEGTTEAGAREVVRSVAEGPRVPGDRSELEPVREHGWAVVEYPVRSRGRLAEPVEGFVALGRQEDRWFYFLARSKADVWPRFREEVERILADWRWTDSNRALGGAAG